MAGLTCVTSGSNPTYRRAYIENHSEPQVQPSCLQNVSTICELFSRVEIYTKFMLFFRANSICIRSKSRYFLVFGDEAWASFCAFVDRELGRPAQRDLTMLY
jgi:hypothetical protein